tara:strand:+ start:188 stop:1462 length:1275 start_codon:yes stop_codon:yes gene_type:complete
MSDLINKLIEDKSNSLPHTSSEIKHIVDISHNSNHFDDKIILWLKSVYKNGMNRSETINYTDAIISSGDKLNFDLNGYIIDKHSTGGVGDKVSLILGPILAACGCYVPMIVGRALGHTGGTLDKLESIQNYNGLINLDKFKNIVKDVGISIIGQTNEICPADKKIYRLRDLSDTIDSFPLICGSIMGKKIAEGIEGLVLDIKTGNGAFMVDFNQANKLGEFLKSIGSEFNLNVDYLVTDMNQPLGIYSGLLCEVKESIDFLKNENQSKDLFELIYKLGLRGLNMAGIDNGEQKIRSVLEDGTAYEIFCKMVHAHGGDINKVILLPSASENIIANSDGYLNIHNTKSLGMSIDALSLGSNNDNYKKFDPQSGFKLYKKHGEYVNSGDRIAKIFCSDHSILSKGSFIFKKSISILKELPTLYKVIH